jgi:hypothetical protein
MTLEHDLLQLALGAMRSLMSGRDFAVGQTGHYLNIISRIEAELSRPQINEFYPDWDMLKPYHERIKELEQQLAKPEQEAGKCGCGANLYIDENGKPCSKVAKTEQEHMFDTPDSHIVKWSIPVDPNNFGELLAQPEQEPVAWMLPEYGDVLSANQADGTGIYNIPLYTAPPRKEWVGLTDDERDELLNGSTRIPSRLIDWVEQKLKEKNT